jgi:hypothetical protein
MPDDHSLRELELHTLEDMRWNDNYQCPFKQWSEDIIKGMRWLMWKPAYAKDLVDTFPHSFNSDTPPKSVSMEMHSVI